MNDADPSGKLRLAVLLSGGGRSLQYLHEAAATGAIPARIVRVVSSRPDAYGVTRARDLGYDPVIVQRKGSPQAEFDRRMTQALIQANVDLICMAGFLVFWRIPPAFENRVMNIHPALLPDFGGKGFHGHRVHEAVLAAGRPVSGCTVHFADNAYDHGPIILQRQVPVMSNDTPDTLADRVFEAEKEAYPEAIRLFAAGRLLVVGTHVQIATEGSNAGGMRT
ncbi:MAG: phosphoribosylglycinamide formyltransferase [Phycisphaerae bacterium]|nr:phosphoribosylglycinamide formyltransferase [Phycisphaerae bacterium]